MSQSPSGRRVLITGGTGSFGQTMAARLLSRDVDEVRILSRDEAKQDALRLKVDQVVELLLTLPEIHAELGTLQPVPA